MLLAGNCLRGTYLTFENFNLVTVKISSKEDGTNLKHWITVYLLDTQILFQGCFLSVVRNDFSHLHYLIIVIQ